MVCYHPVQCYLVSDPSSSTGQRMVHYVRAGDDVRRETKRACGGCIGCRLEYSRGWAVRCTHESQMHDLNCFITLTYNDEWLPKDGSLDIRHFQLFMKRLRKEFGDGIRVFYCGEYGDKNRRPHWHAAVFAHDFCDKTLFRVVNGERLYVSQALQRLWSCPESGESYGFSTVGTVTFASAAYIARYVTKKITGKPSPEHYGWWDRETGELFDKWSPGRGLRPEFAKMSLKPGIGRAWIERYMSDVYPSDEVILNGKRFRPPSYYDDVLKLRNPEMYDEIKDRRERQASRWSVEQTDDRLLVKEYIQLVKAQRLIRQLDSGVI